MILALPESDALRALSVAFRLAYYLAGLGAAGLAAFALLFRHRQHPLDAAACGRVARGLAAAGIGAGMGWLAALVAIASEGDPFEADLWPMMLSARPGISVLAGGAGLLVLMAAPATGRAAGLFRALGVLVVAASFAAVGHTTQYRPRLLLAAMLAVHLLAVAFWAGSLWPLLLACRRGGPGAAVLVEDWARVASWAVGALVLAGAGLAWAVVGRVDILVTTAYGAALLAKIALLGALLGFAAWHRFRLTPALAAGRPGSGARLAASIGWEIAVMGLVFWAVAEMTATSPVARG